MGIETTIIGLPSDVPLLAWFFLLGSSGQLIRDGHLDGLQDCLAVSRAKLRPTPDTLWAMIKRYFNILIGRVFGVSEASVWKWMKKWDIVRRQ